MGGRSQISVDIETVAGLGTALGKLYTEFDGVPHRANDINDSIGSADVRDAMNDFADNWNSRRKRLLESIGAVRDSANSAEKAFSDVDLELANNILGKE